MHAIERSPINNLELRFLLQNVLTSETDDRDVIIHGIDQSCYYEGHASTVASGIENMCPIDSAVMPCLK